jgi:hypothetical protein
MLPEAKAQDHVEDDWQKKTIRSTCLEQQVFHFRPRPWRGPRSVYLVLTWVNVQKSENKFSPQDI